MKFTKFLIVILLLSANLSLVAQTRGKASYYSSRLHGRRTSDGNRYHRDSLTCAHLSYPFGTYIKVRNLANDKEVIVKVTDRGPHVRGRIIDLSYAAAKEIGLIAQGIGSVEITKLDKQLKSSPSDTIENLQEFTENTDTIFVTKLPDRKINLLKVSNQSLIKYKKMTIIPNLSDTRKINFFENFKVKLFKFLQI